MWCLRVIIHKIGRIENQTKVKMFRTCNGETLVRQRFKVRLEKVNFRVGENGQKKTKEVTKEKLNYRRTWKEAQKKIHGKAKFAALY